MDVSYDWVELLDLRFIVGPILLHVSLAALLRLWVLPHAADRCVWLSMYITATTVGWFLFGWTFDVSNIVSLLPTLTWRILLFVKIQWFLVVYFVASSWLVAKQSDTGWVVMRKFVPASMLMLCYIYKWSPPSMVIRFTYLIVHFMVVDVGVDLYYMIKALKDTADVKGEEGLNFIDHILNVMYPLLVVAWGFMIKQTYDLVADYNLIMGYAIIAMQLAIQVCVLLPIKWRN